MREREDLCFYDTSSLKKTEEIESRCNKSYIEDQIRKAFPEEELTVTSCTINNSGKFINKADGALMSFSRSHRIENLPPYTEVRVNHKTEKHYEEIIIWVPLAWNDRFIGTAGGGTGCGGERYILINDYSRGETLPIALLNGFSSATTNAGGSKNNWALNNDGTLNYDLIENWRSRSTHFMTLLGKKVTEILHERKVKYSYFHGGSGGGRQSMMEAEEHGEDYNGIWASCPAINWNKFLIAGYWPVCVMNTLHHKITIDTLNFFMHKVWNKVGGEEAYYDYEGTIEINPFDYVGEKNGKKRISKEDADVMDMIWKGPVDEEGNKMCAFYRPGVLFWIKGLPVGALYYTLLTDKPRTFFLCDHYARWITENPKEVFYNMNIDDFRVLFRKSLEKFPSAMGTNPDLSVFKNNGGKLIVDHGIDDPLIPVDGSVEYYKSVVDFFGSEEEVSSFFKLYITPGDGHGNCTYHNAGIMEKDGMKALIDWVENGKAPEEIRKVKATNKGAILKEGVQKPFILNS